MERESTQHGPRIDEDLAHRTASLTHGAAEESRSQEARLEEEDAIGGMNPSRRPDLPGPTPSLSDTDLAERADLARYLAGAHFPATGSSLVKHASARNAIDSVMDRLRSLAPDASFENFAAVWTAGGRPME